jgi:hypothetical protein
MSRSEATAWVNYGGRSNGTGEIVGSGPGGNITWDSQHRTWLPHGWDIDKDDPDHVHSNMGFDGDGPQKGYWHEDEGQWKNAKTDKPISF